MAFTITKNNDQIIIEFQYDSFFTLIKFLSAIALSSFIINEMRNRDIELWNIIGIILLLLYLIYLSTETYIEWYFNKKIIINRNDNYVIINGNLFSKLTELSAVYIRHDRGKYENGWTVFLENSQKKKKILKKYMIKEEMEKLSYEISNFLNLKVIDINKTN